MQSCEKIYMFYRSNFWYASKTILRQMEKLQTKSWKLIQSSSHFSDKEYNHCLRSINSFPISSNCLINHVVLNKVLTSHFALRGEQFWQKRNGHTKTRSNEKIFLHSIECNHQRCRCIFFLQVTIRCH